MGAREAGTRRGVGEVVSRTQRERRRERDAAGEVATLRRGRRGGAGGMTWRCRGATRTAQLGRRMRRGAGGVG
jgi:hypothetical protein